jgi:flagellar biosynthesis anti-sigma factor FlgM
MADPIQSVKATGPLEVSSPGQPANAPPATDSASATSTPAVDSADVARAEALLASISANVQSVPTVDEMLVSELRQAIQSGTYQPDPQQIAQKLLQIEELLTLPETNP